MTAPEALAVIAPRDTHDRGWDYRWMARVECALGARVAAPLRLLILWPTLARLRPLRADLDL